MLNASCQSRHPRVVVTLAIVAGLVFAGVAVHWFNYASGHPYAYGRAKVIACGGVAGAVMSVAVGLLGYALTRFQHRP